MSELAEPIKANLTISVMFRDEALLEETRAILEKKYGEIDAVSEVYDFSSISPYYDPEMGSGIKKIVFSFKEPVPRDLLKDVKLFCVQLEKERSDNGNRLVNLDPGLVTLENFILATGKNYSHRIYLGSGVFAEVTLIFGKKNAIRELPWSYRDYLYEPARSFLLEVRELYRAKRAELLKNTEN
ncbi:DUF4416 family protein [bacterium]|nr:DUF4416 family protein [bacterium]MBP5591668.1 DUF4416 family protein [bacterium]